MPTRDDAGALAHLQRFQRDFDERCGFDFPCPDNDADGRLHRIEFACLALAGETGEVANLLKKARRRAWTHGDVTVDRAAVAEELADVFAYTLKLANLLDVDLEDAYRRKMDVNAHRFGGRPQLVMLMGPPGAGKTTIASRLAEEVQVHIERATLNARLEVGTWADKQHAMASQLRFLTAIEQSVCRATPDLPMVLDQHPRAVVRVYGRLFEQAGHLDSDALERLGDALGVIERRLSAWRNGTHVLLLDASADVLHSRVLHRDGRSLGIDWIADVRQRFADFAMSLGTVETVRTDAWGPEDVVALVRARLETP